MSQNHSNTKPLDSKENEWIGIAEAAKVLNRGHQGVRFHIRKGNIRTKQGVYGFRVINLVNKADCEKLAKTLAPRKFWKKHKGAPMIEKSTGYLKVYEPKHNLAMCDGYVYMHRKVAQEKIGRGLKVGEIVHHINGIKTDNRPENLEVLPSISRHVSGHFAAKKKGASK